MALRPLDVAQHEAAHVVVGVALGLRLGRAVVGPATLGTEELAGWCWFPAAQSKRRRETGAIMYAAGVAWDRSIGAPKASSSIDLRRVRELASGKHGVETYVTAAAAILAGRTAAHALVTRALLEHDLGPSHIEAFARGELWVE